MKVNGQLQAAQVEAVTDTAARPSAGSKGRILYDLALGQLIYDNGSEWVVLPKQSDTYTKSDVYTKTEQAIRFQYKSVSYERPGTSLSGHTDEASADTVSFTGMDAGWYQITGAFRFSMDHVEGSLPSYIADNLEAAIVGVYQKSDGSSETVIQAEASVDSDADPDEPNSEHHGIFVVDIKFELPVTHDGGKVVFKVWSDLNTDGDEDHNMEWGYRLCLQELPVNMTETDIW